MMTLKRFAFILLFLGLIPTACNREKLMHFTMHQISFEAYHESSLTSPISSADVIQDSIVYFKLGAQINYVAYMPSFDFSTPLYAMKKPRKGENGLSTKLSDIKITSDNLFNGVQAGESLTNLFAYTNEGNDNQMEVAELKKRLNTLAFFDDYSSTDFRLILQTKPTDSLTHRFTFEFVYSNGTVQSATSQKLTWN